MVTSFPCRIWTSNSLPKTPQDSPREVHQVFHKGDVYAVCKLGKLKLLFQVKQAFVWYVSCWIFLIYRLKTHDVVPNLLNISDMCLILLVFETIMMLRHSCNVSHNMCTIICLYKPTRGRVSLYLWSPWWNLRQVSRFVLHLKKKPMSFMVSVCI